MTEFSPIILLASERSGTNLLRALMASHTQIAAPPPCSIVDILDNYYYRYLPPAQSPYLAELAEDAITLTKSHLNPWDIDLTTEEVLAEMRSVSFWGLFKAINEIYAKNTNKFFWFSKEPGLFRHVYELKLHLPNVKFIYMVRDGRDVAASMLKGGIHEHHVYAAAQRWSSEQKLCLSAFSDPLIRSQAIMLRYEDLIEDTESQMQRLMHFVGLSYEPGQMEYHRNEAVRKHAEKSKFWKNISAPIDASNKGKYRNSLSAREIRIFESVARTEMKLLGYSLDYIDQMKISLLGRAAFRLSEYARRKYQSLDRDEGNSRLRARSKIFHIIQNRKLS